MLERTTAPVRVDNEKIDQALKFVGNKPKPYRHLKDFADAAFQDKIKKLEKLKK